MSDPAVEAAQRAWDDEGWGGPGRPLSEGMSEAELAKAAAREALAPIRELHKPMDPADPERTDCTAGCGQAWPCDTARLIYTSEELK